MIFIIYVISLCNLQVESTEWQNSVKFSRRFEIKMHQRILFNIIITVIMMMMMMMMILIIIMKVEIVNPLV